MILQSLYDLYKRLAENPDNGLPTSGYSLQGISLRVILTQEGTLIEIKDEQQEIIKILKGGREKRSKRPVELLVPGQARASEASFEPCFLWDDTRFVFGWHGVKNDETRNSKCFENFKNYHLSLEKIINDQDFTAVCNFLKGWTPKNAPINPTLSVVKKGRVIFQISGKTSFVHENLKIKSWVDENIATSPKDNVPKGQCLVTGESEQNLARLHPGIFGIFGSPYTGASLVSFNLNAFTSLSRDQGYNSPVSEKAAFAYTNALSWLLSNKERSFRIGDATTVFWTSEATEAETLLPWMISGVPTEDDVTKKRVHNVLGYIARGTLAQDELGDPRTNYFILGLSLNQGRLSVRFWHTGTLGELIANLKLHFDQLSIIRQLGEESKNPDSLTPSAYQLICQTSRDADGIPPLLGGALLRSIFLGTAYPESLAASVINRIRAERDINYLKACILKAWLIRNHKTWLEQQYITMKTALDKENPNIAYQLGRLFAVYEQIQRVAHEFKLERTIRETMFSAASSTPQTVFGRIDRLNKHHLSKLTPGSNRYYSDLLDEIHQKVIAPSFYPASLNLKEQSLFCIGYYHQRHDLLPKKDTMKID